MKPLICVMPYFVGVAISTLLFASTLKTYHLTPGVYLGIGLVWSVVWSFIGVLLMRYVRRDLDSE